jgi:hypothetical protein
MTWRHFPVLAFAVVLASAACTDARMPTSSVDDSTFVRTIVELQKLANDTSLDSLMRDSTRHVILRRHGLTTEELVQAARAMAYDPDHAERVWTAISTAGMKKAPATTPRMPTHFGTPSGPKP